MGAVVQQFKESTQQRVFALGFLDGAGTGIQNVIVGVIIAQRFGLAAAGVVLGVSAMGRFGSPLVFSFVDRHPKVGSDEMHRLFRWAVVGMTVTSLAVVGAAIWGTPVLTVAIGLVWALCNSVSTIIATSAVPTAIAGYGPVAMVGTATGAWIAAVAVTGGVNGVSAVAAVVLAAVLLLQLFEVPLIATVTFEPVAQVQAFETVRHAGKGLVLGVLAYGPLLVYQALTLKIASVNWVGWAMVVYALGALAAIPFSKRLTGFYTFPGVMLLGAIGVGVWLLAFNGPTLLVTRFISGLVLFTAQGRLLHIAYSGDGEASTARLAGVSTGLGVGASTGAIIAANLADSYSVAVMAAALTTATIATAAAVKALQVYRATRTTKVSPVSR